MIGIDNGVHGSLSGSLFNEPQIARAVLYSQPSSASPPSSSGQYENLKSRDRLLPPPRPTPWSGVSTHLLPPRAAPQPVPSLPQPPQDVNYTTQPQSQNKHLQNYHQGRWKERTLQQQQRLQKRQQEQEQRWRQDNEQRWRQEDDRQRWQEIERRWQQEDERRLQQEDERRWRQEDERRWR